MLMPSIENGPVHLFVVSRGKLDITIGKGQQEYFSKFYFVAHVKRSEFE